MSIFETIKNKAVTTAGRSLLKVQKYSPEILTSVGIAGTVASGVMLVKATLNADEVVDKAQERIRLVKEHHEMKPKDVQEKDQDDFKRNLAAMYLRAGLDFTKLYGPAVSLGVASIGCIIAAHGIMRKRNAALVAAYKVVETGFSEYRKRIMEELGEEQERDIFHNLKETSVADEEDGEEKIVVENPGLDEYSTYARFFDETSNNWVKNPDYNKVFLRAQQNYFNDLLIARGHVFLNEVYDALDLPRSQAGALVGWVHGGKGDNYIDFGMYTNNNSSRTFINGLESAVLLDFNVDGVIYDLI